MSETVPQRGRPAGLTGRELLAVGREVLLERGYAGTSMDEIAARARISKTSLYREHPSKAALFAAVVGDWAEAGRDSMKPALERLTASRDVRSGLIELGETMRAAILSEPVLQMRRLVTSEAPTHPEVAATYLAESWDANISALAGALQVLTHAGRLRATDPDLAAEHLTWLVIGAPLNAQLLARESARRSSVADAVDLFLARYGAARA